jgi:small subunit ribosomal protein S6
LHNRQFLTLPFKESAIAGGSDRMTGDGGRSSVIGQRTRISFHKFTKKPYFRSPINFFTKNREMNNYELMVIFTPVLSEEDYKAAQNKFTAFVKDNGGKVVHDNPWGLKSLAYPIQKKTTGLYWVMEYNAPSDFNEKLKIQILRDETVLRFMATRLDKYAVEYNARKKSGVPTGTEKAEA